MKIFPFQLLLTFSLMSIIVRAQTVTPSILKQLDKTETAMFDAISNGDSAAFKKIAGKDYYTINADGVDMKLQATLKDMLKFKGSSVQLSQQHQRKYGNLVLRNGNAKFYFAGQWVAEVLYTTGWVYRNNKWQFVHWQGTFTGMSLRNSTPALPTSNSNSDSTTKFYLLELDRKIQEAIVIGDTVLLDSVLADDFLFTHGFMNGGQENKTKWRSLATRKPAFYFYRKVDSSIVELHGDIALVMGTLSIKRRPNARNNETENRCFSLAYSHVYVFRNNRWQFLSHRTTKSIQPTQPCE